MTWSRNDFTDEEKTKLADLPASPGDVTGPAGAVAGNLPLLDATGKILSDSGKKPGDFLEAETDPVFSEWLSTTPPAYPGDLPSIAGLLDETAHDLLDHSGITGIPSISGLLDETAHDALDHTGLTGVLAIGTGATDAMAGNTAIPDVSGYGDIVTHDADEFEPAITSVGDGLFGITEATGARSFTALGTAAAADIGTGAGDVMAGDTAIPSISGLLDETAHDLLDHTGLTGIPAAYTDEAAQDAVGSALDTDASAGDIALSYDDATPKISGRVRKAVQAKGSVSGAQTLDLTQYGCITITSGGAITIDLSGTYTIEKLYVAELVITNGGANTWGWAAKFQFVGGTVPVLTASGVDSFTLLTRDGGTTCMVFTNGLDIQAE